jgi:hypothetical protein
MFDVSFAEVLVLVTGAGMLLGRQEVVAGSRLLGIGLGRIIGTFQGIKEKYEEKSRGSDMYKLHSSVREGLMDLTTIGADIVRIGQPSPISSVKMKPVAIHDRAGSIATTHMPLAAASAHMSRQSVKLGVSVESSASGSLNQDAERLARLVLVEDQLKQKRGQSAILEGRNSGADIIQSAVSESILANYYAQQLKKPS